MKNRIGKGKIIGFKNTTTHILIHDALRGRFGMYIPPLMEKLGLAKVTHEAKGNKMREK